MDRPTKKLIIINSKDNKTDNLSNAIYDYGSIELQESYAVRLKDVSIVNLLYNINVGKNDRLEYDYNGSAQFVIIPEGNYNATSLSVALNASQANLIFSINPITQKFIINSALPSFLKGSSTIKGVLGFSIDGAPSVSYELPNPYNLIRTHFINIVSNLTESNACLTSDKKNYSVIAQVPVDLPFGFILKRTEEKDTADNYAFGSNINLSQINIKMLDDDFNELDLNQGSYIISFNVFKR